MMKLVGCDSDVAQKQATRNITAAYGTSVKLDRVAVVLSEYLQCDVSHDDWSSISAQVISRAASEAKPKRRIPAPPPLPLELPPPMAAAASSSAAAIVPLDDNLRFLTRDVGELQLAIVQHAKAARDMKTEMNKLTKSKDYYKHRCSLLESKLDSSHTENKALVLQMNFRPGLRNVSTYGGYTLAIRRNISHVGAKVTAEMLGGSESQGVWVVILLTRYLPPLSEIYLNLAFYVSSGLTFGVAEDARQYF